MKTVFIGIDPDVDKSGFAIYDASKKKLTRVCCMRFFEIMEFLQIQNVDFVDKAFVRIEAGWLNKSNWHTRKNDGVKIASAKGNSVGRNHEVGRKFGEMCEYLGFDYEFVKPLGTKNIDRATFIRLTDYRCGCNQDARDASMLVYGINNK